MSDNIFDDPYQRKWKDPNVRDLTPYLRDERDEYEEEVTHRYEVDEDGELKLKEVRITQRPRKTRKPQAYPGIPLPFRKDRFTICQTQAA